MEEIQLQELESSTTSSNGRSNIFTCEICVEIVPVDRQFKSMEMSRCLHPYCTATSCWTFPYANLLSLMESSKSGAVFLPQRIVIVPPTKLLNQTVPIAKSSSVSENHQCRRHESIIDIDSNDVLFMEMVKDKRLVRCPNCFRYVERNGGCSSVKCSIKKGPLWET
ncbi:uncharacterized protein LOC113306232 [Papaver somniferum]|uniref:uncharacterized protein LOC113306232 n=1 Tax=Papaver somniferum TaxID=3469 RepID=UPI000E6FDD14|nr:uncharacterized protein LOC113306232 [Papaver somniferum]